LRFCAILLYMNVARLTRRTFIGIKEEPKAAFSKDYWHGLILLHLDHKPSLELRIPLDGALTECNLRHSAACRGHVGS
jgi:hypothetical protein